MKTGTKFVKRGMAVSVMACLALSACSKESGDTPKETTQKQTLAPTGTGSGAAAEANPYKDKLSLKLMVWATGASQLPEKSKDFVMQAIESKFNVDLSLTFMAGGSDYNTKINALLASNTPPDMWKDANGDGGSKYEMDGLLADMSPYITAKTMPNYFKWISEKTIVNYQKLETAKKNQIMRTPVTYNDQPYRAYYIRKDWLDKLGMQVPKNYDEYYKVLEAFTKNDPDGNGKNDTFGFAANGNGNSISLDWPEYQKYGLTYASKIENNQYIDSQTDIRVQQVIDDIAKQIKEGLIDPDWFLSNGSQKFDKAVQGKVGIILGTSPNFAYDSNPQSIQNLTRKLFPKADWVPFNPLGNTPLVTRSGPGFPVLFAKTVADKNPEKVKRIISILDWLASEEGYLMTHYGLPDKHYIRTGNTITLKPDAFNQDITEKGNWLNVWSFFTPVLNDDLYGLKVVNPLETDRDREIAAFLKSIPSNEFYGVSLVPPADVDLGNFRKRMGELQVKALFDDKSGANWPKYREEIMTQYGGAKLFQSYNDQLRAAGKIK